jgi:hypothetical protein
MLLSELQEKHRKNGKNIMHNERAMTASSLSNMMVPLKDCFVPIMLPHSSSNGLAVAAEIIPYGSALLQGSGDIARAKESIRWPRQSCTSDFMVEHLLLDREGAQNLM